MNEVDDLGKDYLTPEMAKSQIEQFVNFKGPVYADKYEIAVFLIEHGYVSGMFGYEDDLLIFLNNFPGQNEYTKDDLPKIMDLLEEDMANGRTHEIELRVKR
ncbi:hypothetical protein HXX27_07685 [Weissella confusa]|uniref:hypothetical protein n=1 Tax=Weissella confusa TaxID=1583 RepID=UPI0018A2AFAD|nr:hypothetical protein [Weissella confusa]MBF7056567.1 hypothetical protein [Weissella confusa]